jgi:hypothetical protein
MKNIIASLLLVSAFAFQACTEIKESPTPKKTTDNTGGGGGGGGGKTCDASVDPGLYKLVKREVFGLPEVLDEYYTMDLQGGGIATIRYYDNGGTLLNTINTSYSIQVGQPRLLNFLDDMVPDLTEVSKVNCTWTLKYNDPDIPLLEIVETFERQ